MKNKINDETGLEPLWIILGMLLSVSIMGILASVVLGIFNTVL